MKKISNFFTKHQGGLTIISLIFIYLGSFNLIDSIDDFFLIRLLIFICGIIIIIGIFLNPFVKIKLDIKNKVMRKYEKINK